MSGRSSYAAVASVSPQAGTAQTSGWGLGNYDTLTKYQAGIGQYLLNSAAVSLMSKPSDSDVVTSAAAKRAPSIARSARRRVDDGAASSIIEPSFRALDRFSDTNIA